MRQSSIMDIISPIMVGPSSSHTAGAVRLGLLARHIYKDEPTQIIFKLYNSYANTGKGHGTDKGLLAGFLEIPVDDIRIRDIFELDITKNLNYSFEFIDDLDRHPNAVDFIIKGKSTLKLSGQSIGAGEVVIDKIDDFSVKLNGKYNTLFLLYKDVPGMISKVTSLIPVNIATLNCDRYAKGEDASMCISLDGDLPEETINKIKNLPNIYITRYVTKLEN